MIYGKKGISYKGSLPAATFIISGATHDEFMERLYKITGYERHNIHLAVTARYTVPEEYIALQITVKKRWRSHLP